MFTVALGFGAPSLGAMSGTSPPYCSLLFCFLRASGLLGRRCGPGFLLAFGMLAQDRLPNCLKCAKLRLKLQETFNSQSGEIHFEVEMVLLSLETSPALGELCEFHLLQNSASHNRLISLHQWACRRTT